MRRGLVPGHDLGIPIAVARPLEAGQYLLGVDTIESTYVDTYGSRMTVPDQSCFTRIQ